MTPTPTEAQIAWAAGLFEGEGCFEFGVRRAVKNRTTGEVAEYKYHRMTINMTDRDVLEKFQAIVGCGSVRPLKPRLDAPHRKPVFKWVGNSRSDVVRLYFLFAPWLGERRKQRGAEMLADIAAYEELPHSKKGVVR